MKITTEKKLTILTTIAILLQVSACSTHSVKSTTAVDTLSSNEEEALFVNRVLATGGEAEGIELLAKYLKLLPEATAEKSLAKINSNLGEKFLLEDITGTAEKRKLTEAQAEKILKTWQAEKVEIYAKGRGALSAESDAVIAHADKTAGFNVSKSKADYELASHLKITDDGIETMNSIKAGELALDEAGKSYGIRIAKSFVHAYRRGVKFLTKKSCKISKYDVPALENVDELGQVNAYGVDRAEQLLGKDASAEVKHACSVKIISYKQIQLAKKMGHTELSDQQQLWDNLGKHCDMGSAEVNAEIQQLVSEPTEEPTC